MSYSLCFNDSPFPQFMRVSFKMRSEKNLVRNQKDGAYDSRVQKNEQILKAVAETEYILLQTKVKSSSISWNEAKKMSFKWMRSFLSICTLVG